MPDPQPFGAFEGEDVFEVVLSSDTAEAKVITWGAVIRDLQVTDRAGERRRVVLGLDSLDDYVAHSPYFGAIAGRCGNRIKGSRFTLDGETHALAHKPGQVHLHGGPKGFGRLVWMIADRSARHVTLILHSPDGDEGYPGALDAMCRYTLDGNVLKVEHEARMAPGETKASPVNLLHHSYFNLDGTGDIRRHRLEVPATFYHPVDEEAVPTGEIRFVEGSPYDFRAAREIGDTPLDAGVILDRVDGAQHRIAGNPLAHAATLTSTSGDLAMEQWTTEPGVQIYNAYKLNMTVPGLDGVPYPVNAGICLEAQRFPNSVNVPHFSDTILRPGELYSQTCEFRFS